MVSGALRLSRYAVTDDALRSRIAWAIYHGLMAAETAAWPTVAPPETPANPWAETGKIKIDCRLLADRVIKVIEDAHGAA